MFCLHTLAKQNMPPIANERLQVERYLRSRLVICQLTAAWNALCHIVKTLMWLTENKVTRTDRGRQTKRRTFHKPATRSTTNQTRGGNNKGRECPELAFRVKLWSVAPTCCTTHLETSCRSSCQNSKRMSLMLPLCLALSLARSCYVLHVQNFSRGLGESRGIAGIEDPILFQHAGFWSTRFYSEKLQAGPYQQEDKRQMWCCKTG